MMIDPNSPIVTAALDAWFAPSPWRCPEDEVETLRLAMAAALNAALAEHMRLAGHTTTIIDAVRFDRNLGAVGPGSAEDRP